MSVIASCNDPLSLVFLLTPFPRPSSMVASPTLHNLHTSIFAFSLSLYLAVSVFPFRFFLCFPWITETSRKLANRGWIHPLCTSSKVNEREGRKAGMLKRLLETSIQFGRSPIAGLFKCRSWHGNGTQLRARCISKTNFMEIKRRSRVMWLLMDIEVSRSNYMIARFLVQYLVIIAINECYNESFSNAYKVWVNSWQSP